MKKLVNSGKLFLNKDNPERSLRGNSLERAETMTEPKANCYGNIVNQYEVIYIGSANQPLTKVDDIVRAMRQRIDLSRNVSEVVEIQY